MYEIQVHVPEGTVYKVEFLQDRISELTLWRRARACPSRVCVGTLEHVFLLAAEGKLNSENYLQQI